MVWLGAVWFGFGAGWYKQEVEARDGLLKGQGGCFNCVHDAMAELPTVHHLCVLIEHPTYRTSHEPLAKL